jgi:hypothetical protein
MKTGSQPIAARQVTHVSRPRRIPLPIRRKPASSGEPAVATPADQPRPRLLRVRDPAAGSGMSTRKPGPFSPAPVMTHVRVMFRDSAAKQPGNQRAPTAFPEVPHGLRIAADPPRPARRQRRHPMAVAGQAATGSIALDAGISWKTTAQAPAVRVVLRRGYQPAIRNVRPRTHHVVFLLHRPHRLSHQHAQGRVTGSGNRIAASGFAWQAVAAAAVPAVAHALHRRIRAWIATRAVPPVVRLPQEEQRPLMIPANRLRRQRPAIRTTVKASVTGNGMAPRGRLIHPRARPSARVIRSHRSQEHRWGRSSRSAARLLWAAVRSLATNGICRWLVSDCVSRRSKKPCTW